MEATMGATTVTKMLCNRWSKIRKEIPKMCLIAGEKDPFAISIAAAAMILRAEILVAKKIGTEFDIMAYAKEVKKDADEVEEIPVEELLKKALKEAADTVKESEGDNDE